MHTDLDKVMGPLVASACSSDATAIDPIKDLAMDIRARPPPCTDPVL